MANNNKGEEEDPINEEFKDDSFDDLDDADDSFGLPDVDVKPLDEVTSEAETTDSESELGSEEHDSDEPEADTHSGSGTGGSGYGSGGGGNGGSGDDDEGYQYEAPKRESIAPKIIAFLLILIIAAGAVWYFAFYRPAEAKKAEQERIAQQKEQARQDSIKRVEDERKRQEELARQQEELARQDTVEVETVTPGEVTILTERTSRYYVVLGSFIDQDLAMDYGKRLGDQGLSTSVIPSGGGIRYAKLVTSPQDSNEAAEAKAEELRATYGSNLWVLKY